MPDPANVAANWAKYFDDDNQCNYYYNSVTQESSWSRPACMEFVNTNQKSSSLLAAAFGTDEENENENENEPVNIDIPVVKVEETSNPPIPTAPSPFRDEKKNTRKSQQQEEVEENVANSFDSNDEFFAQLEEEVEIAEKVTSEEDKIRIARLEEEEKAKRQAVLEKIEDEKRLIEAKKAEERAIKETEEADKLKAAAALAAKEEAEKNAAKEEADRAAKEAKAKRQAELNKIVAERKKKEELEEAERKLNEAKEKQKAELEKFKAAKKAEMEAKQKADAEAERVKEKEKEEAALKRKQEVEKVTSTVENDEVEDDVIDYSLSVSKAEDSPREIEDDSDVKVVEEKEVPPLANSEVEDAVEHHEAATKLQSLQRARLAKKRVNVIKKESKKKRYDEYMSKQNEKEQEIITMQVKNGVNDKEQMDSAAVKLQSLQRKRATQKEVGKIKVAKNDAAVKLQSLHRRRASQQLVAEMKVDRERSLNVKKEQENTNNDTPAMNDSDLSAQSSAASLPTKRVIPQPKKIEITEIKDPVDTKPIVKETPAPKPKQYSGYKEGEVTPKPKPKVVKKVPRNNPRDAIAEAAKFLEENEKSSNNSSGNSRKNSQQPLVPETKSEELTLPKISSSSNKIEPVRRRKKSNHGLDHVNKRTMESLEQLEKVAQETALPLESQSAPPNGRLPQIGPRRVSETERRKKKEPLFMRLEAEGRARSLAIEKEKRDNYLKLKESKREAKPSKQAIMEHMRKYDEERKAHLSKEKEYAEAKKKEWHEKAKQLKTHNKSPPRRKKLWEEDAVAETEKENNPTKKKRRESPVKAPPIAKVTPRKVKKKLLKGNKKLDFVEEEKERKAKAELAKKERLAKGKMYGKLAPAKHAKNASPARRKLSLIDNPELPSSPFGGPVAQSIVPSPRGPVAQSVVSSPRSPKRASTKIHKLVSRISTEDYVDTDEARDVLRSPVINPRKRFSRGQSAIDPEALSPVLSIPKNKKRSPLKSRMSSLEDSNSSVPNIDAPYDGVVGSEWVSQVMEMDMEEATLADVYESGFEMFMIEKGIIQDV